MVLAFRSATEAGTGSAATSLNINIPSGVVDGDHLLLFGVTADGDDGGFDALSGWTEILDAATFNTGGSAPSPPGMSVWTRIASSDTPGSSRTITPSFGSTGICAKMLAFSGGDGTTMIDVTSVTATGDGTNADPGTIVPTTDGALTVVAAFWDSTTTVWSAAPSGYTDAGGLGSVTGSGGGNGCTMAAAYRNSVIDPAASENPAAFSSSAEQWGAPTIALRPAPAGITSVTPDEFDMDNADVDVASTADVFDASGNDVYLSDADTLAGSANEVDVSSAINTEAVGLINLDFTQLSAGELDDLQTLGPGARYVIVVTGASDEYAWPITLHRPQAFSMSASTHIAASGENTTFQLTAPAGKSTTDFGGGRIQDDENPGDAVNLALDEYREDEWSLVDKALAEEDAQYEFRLLVGGAVPGTLTIVPKWTIASGTLDVGAVPAGTAIPAPARVDQTVAVAVIAAAAAVLAPARVDQTASVPSVGAGTFVSWGEIEPPGRVDQTVSVAAIGASALIVEPGRDVEVPAGPIGASTAIVGPRVDQETAVGATGAATAIVAPDINQGQIIAVPAIGAVAAVVAPVLDRTIPVSAVAATAAILAPSVDQTVGVGVAAAATAIVAPDVTAAQAVAVTAISAAAAIVAPERVDQTASVGAETAGTAIQAPDVQFDQSVAVSAIPASTSIVAPSVPGGSAVPAVAAGTAVLAPRVDQTSAVSVASAATASVAPLVGREVDVDAVAAAAAVLAPDRADQTVPVGAVPAGTASPAPTIDAGGGDQNVPVPAIAAATFVGDCTVDQETAVGAIAARAVISAPSVPSGQVVGVGAIPAAAAVLAPGRGRGVGAIAARAIVVAPGRLGGAPNVAVPPIPAATAIPGLLRVDLTVELAPVGARALIPAVLAAVPTPSGGFVVPWDYTIVDVALHSEDTVSSGTARILIDGALRQILDLSGGLPFHAEVDIDGDADSEIHVQLETLSGIIDNPRASLWLRRRRTS